MASVKNIVLDPELPKKFFLNRGVVSVLSALILAPTLVLAVRRFAGKNPILARNISVFLIVVGIVLFGIAIAMLKGMPQAILLGIGAGIAFAGLTPFIEQFVSRGRNVINR